jgi:glutathionyl-hydroquinone reductase
MGTTPSVDQIKLSCRAFGIAERVSLDHIKRHYCMTHDDLNPTRIVPIGPEL